MGDFEDWFNQMDDKKPEAITPASVDPSGLGIAASILESTIVSEDELKKQRLARLQELQDELLADGVEVVGAALRFADVAPGPDGKMPTEPPVEWIEKYGYANARRRLEIAKSAWLSPKEAPVALQLASRTVQSLTRATAESASQRTLNVSVASLVMNVQNNYPIKDVDQ